MLLETVVICPGETEYFSIDIFLKFQHIKMIINRQVWLFLLFLKSLQASYPLTATTVVGLAPTAGPSFMPRFYALFSKTV